MRNRRHCWGESVSEVTYPAKARVDSNPGVVVTQATLLHMPSFLSPSSPPPNLAHHPRPPVHLYVCPCSMCCVPVRVSCPVTSQASTSAMSYVSNRESPQVMPPLMPPRSPQPMVFLADRAQGTDGHTCRGATLPLLEVILCAHRALCCHLMQPYCVHTGPPHCCLWQPYYIYTPRACAII